MLVRDKEYRVVIQPAYKFFGSTQVNAYGSLVNMAEPEKTILDSLERPIYAGDIPEVAGMLQRGKSSLDWPKLVDYAIRLKSRALLQRLGYLSDLLRIPLDSDLRRRLLVEASGDSKCYLGQTRRWNTGGVYNATWRVVDNLPQRELLAEIEAHS